MSLKNNQRRLKIGQSGEISPNLVTLKTSGQAVKKSVANEPNIKIAFCDKWRTFFVSHFVKLTPGKMPQVKKLFFGRNLDFTKIKKLEKVRSDV